MKRLINHSPTPAARLFLGMLPFLVLLLVYLASSETRLALNPHDKLLPSFSQFADAIHRMAFVEDKRTGQYLFWADTLSSLTRLGLGMLIAAGIGLVLGLGTGSLPMVGAAVSPLLTVVSLIPPLAILPILFIVFGLGEVSKVALIAIGTAPFIARDLQRRAQDIPREQLVKAQTLGANTSQIICRVLLPQLLPCLIDAVRLALGPAWLFLISAEAIAATDGLGFRIFLMRRYMAMDVILPYVLWITLLAFVVDIVLAWLNRRLFPWRELGGV